jgi:O-antigen ligase
MSATRSQAIVPMVPPLSWWLVLAIVLTAFLAIHWAVALVILILLVIQRARPLDFHTSYLLAVSVGSFVNYGAGRLTFEMSILTVFLVFSLFCYALSRRWDMFVFPRTPATKPLLLWLTLSTANFVRGMAVGNSARYGGLEYLAVLGLGSSLLVASRRYTEGEIKGSLTWLFVLGLMHSALGMYIFSIIHARTGSVYFMPTTGMVAVMLFNFALREEKLSRRVLWVGAMIPLLLHQFLSFTRGYWFGCIGGTLFSMLVYVGRSEGNRMRWKRVGVTLGILLGFGILGVGMLASTLNISAIWNLAGARFASSTGTDFTWESSSNVVRLVEYVRVAEDIIQKPIFGWGLGYYFVVREPITFTLSEQWYTHEMYLYVWLKQGLIGLALWLWLLVALVRTGVSGRRLPSFWEQSWCVGAAGVVVYIMVFSLVHFPLAEVNATFTFALVNGVAMAAAARGTIAFRWKGRRSLVATAEPAR